MPIEIKSTFSVQNCVGVHANALDDKHTNRTTRSPVNWWIGELFTASKGGQQRQTKSKKKKCK